MRKDMHCPMQAASSPRPSQGRKLVSAISLVLFATLVQPALRAESSDHGLDANRLADIQKRMQEYVDQGQASGIVTLVEKDGKVIQSTAVGMQNIENNKPMRKDSIFQIMSMTKPFTAVGIMMLAEDGKLSVYDNVEKYLPEFHNQKVRVNGWLRTPTRPIRICDLLSHTSGMPNLPEGSMATLYQTMDHSLADAVKAFATEPLDFEPGTHWLYSNPGMAILGRIIEVVSGQSYEKFIEERLLRPLEMKDTFFFPPADKLDRIAIVYSPKDGKFERAGADSLGGDPAAYRKGAKYPAPEFGLFSTVEDLSHFCEMILGNGQWHGIRFLSPASLNAMREVQTANMEAGWYPGADYGLAWEIVSRPVGTVGLLPKGTYGHGGAFGTHEWIIPSRNMFTLYMVACNGACSDTPERAFQAMVQASVQ